MSYIYSYDFNTFKNFSIIYVNIFEDKIFNNLSSIRSLNSIGLGSRMNDY